MCILYKIWISQHRKAADSSHDKHDHKDYSFFLFSVKDTLEKPEPEIESEQVYENDNDVLHISYAMVNDKFCMLNPSLLYICSGSLQANYYNVKIEVYTDGSSLGNPGQ